MMDRILSMTQQEATMRKTKVFYLLLVLRKMLQFNPLLNPFVYLLHQVMILFLLKCLLPSIPRFFLAHFLLSKSWFCWRVYFMGINILFPYCWPSLFHVPQDPPLPSRPFHPWSPWGNLHLSCSLYVNESKIGYFSCIRISNCCYLHSL